MYCNRLQPALQNLLQHVVRFFHPRSSCTTMHIPADVQRITLNASRLMISGRRTKQLYIFCRVTGFTSDFISFIVVEHIWFSHGAIQMYLSWGLFHIISVCLLLVEHCAFFFVVVRLASSLVVLLFSYLLCF